MFPLKLEMELNLEKCPFQCAILSLLPCKDILVKMLIGTVHKYMPGGFFFKGWTSWSLMSSEGLRSRAGAMDLARNMWAILQASDIYFPPKHCQTGNTVPILHMRKLRLSLVPKPPPRQVGLTKSEGRVSNPQTTCVPLACAPQPTHH